MSYDIKLVFANKKKQLYSTAYVKPMDIAVIGIIGKLLFTGVVKLTPAHDPTDFTVGKKLLLKYLEVIDEKGNLTEICGEFSGLRRFDARDIVLAELTKLNLLRGNQDHQMIIPICSRSKDIVEFLVKPQWFIKCGEMAKQAIKDVHDGRLSIVPKELEKTWFNWLENIR